MRRKDRLPELLAPAGDFECLVAAVSAGADAIYIGAKEFSARAYAKNFDLDEISRASSYCHLHGVKLYVTVNTATLIPPSLVLLGVHVDGEHVLLTVKLYQIGDINLKGIIAAEVMLHQASVEINRRVRRNALKQQGDSLGPIGGIVQRKILDVPRVIVLKEAESAVFVLVGNSLNHIVVRKLHLVPTLGFVLKIVLVAIDYEFIVLAGRAVMVALGLCRDVRNGFVLRHGLLEIAPMEIPILIKIQNLSHFLPPLSVFDLIIAFFEIFSREIIAKHGQK